MTDRRSFLRTLLTAGALAPLGAMLSAEAEAQGQPRASGPPPAPRWELRPPPRRGYTWVPGFWTWDTRRGWVWNYGRWEQNRPGFVFAGPRWVLRRGQWVYEPGRWVRQR